MYYSLGLCDREPATTGSFFSHEISTADTLRGVERDVGSGLSTGHLASAGAIVAEILLVDCCVML